ncbi:hypothetical protein G5I_14687 [Acromyrmex echinatior]|uniref:Uncharacterized protein n=1 Tax=Acromyrmex echinatior TaxID=103372 RepID=F4X882_ACREC|nr:hypothetical protein G5I_14687 [Acromyrmex echinatior]
MLLQFHDVLARVRTDVTFTAARARTKWELLIMTTGRRRDGLSLLDNLRVFRLVTGTHSRPALITSYPWHRARAVTPGSRRSGRSARREGKLAVETANCGRPLSKRVRGGRGASTEAEAGGRSRHKHRYQNVARARERSERNIRSRERGREKEMKRERQKRKVEARKKVRRSGQDDVDHAEDTACLKWARPANGGYGLCFRSGPPYPLPSATACVYSWLSPCHFSPISRIMCESTDMAGGWIKLLRPPSSTYLPRPSDIELRIPVKATLKQRRFPES